MVENVYLDGLQLHESTTMSLTEFGLGSPAPREVSANRPHGHGSVDVTEFYDGRVIPVQGEVWAATAADYHAAVDNLKGACRLPRGGGLKVLRFRRAGLAFDERVLVRVAGPVDVKPPPGGAAFAQFGFELFAPDPRVYTDTVSAGSYDPTSAGSGFISFPLVFPLGMSGAGSSTLNVVNEGNIDTPVKLTVTGPAVNPVITNETTGQAVYTTGLALGAGDFIVIDTATRTCRLAGSTLRPDLIDSSRTTWFELAPGTNQLRMSGSGMSAGATSLAAEFRSARI